ncbi:MAG: extracellular solute-binding protein, partial [Ruminococcus sp.]|nr:extracellular solute-binding protein [Ruminococcus sp.]
DSDGFPMGAMKGYFQPIDNYIDLSSPIWSNPGTKTTMDKLKFEGNHYIAATGSYPNIICIYNKKTIRDNGLEDPAELYRNDRWTWSKFKEMCEKFTDPGSEKFALDGYWFNQGINSSVGVPIIGLDEKGKALSNLESPEVRKAQDFLSELEKAKVYFDRTTHDSLSRGSGATGEGMAEGLTLFYPCGMWAIENSPENTALFGDVEAGDIMFVPMPRADDGDKYYIDARIDNGYLLVKNAPNPEGFAALMNCVQLAAHSDSAIDVSTDQLKNTYKWNDEMIEMKNQVNELCEQTPVFDFSNAVSPEVYNITNEVKYATVNGTMSRDWDTVISEYNDRLNFELEKANSQIPEF